MTDEDYSGWSLRDRLELLAFDARLAGVLPTLITVLWEAIERLCSHDNGATLLQAAGDLIVG